MSDRPLTPTRLLQMQSLFEQVLDEPAENRAAALERLAPEDAGIRADVLSLLSAHDRGDTALRSPISQSALSNAGIQVDRRTGTRVGAYEVIRQIGVGGMGAVYEAARADDQFRKRVAMKFLHAHASTPLSIRRFKAERQILAGFSHPGIATLLDGGVTDDGQPYLVMEFIDGLPITEWCDERRLSIDERLKLLLQVTAAVRSAHQALVVHRDLKPGNILVTADGQAKLLDFGIARLLPSAVDSDSVPTTLAEHRSFTPEYAAPEQVRGAAAGTAVDIYSLGVVMFELLTGSRPFDLRGKSFAEIEQVVCNTEAPRPSRRVSEVHAERMRERSESRARSSIEGDLDAIVGVALRKEPERRYGSADFMARDIENYLEGHPVSARPDSVGYRLRKLVRRRKVETAAFAFAAISLVTGFAGVTLQAQRAEQQGRRAARVTEFLTSMLGAADPASMGRDVTVREVLDSAAVRADGLGDSPDLDADIRTVIGNTYMALGEFEAGRDQFQRATIANRRRAPDGDYSTVVALSKESHALEYLGEYGAADSVLGLASEMVERFPPPDPLARAGFLDHRGRILARLGRNDEAEQVFQEVLDITLREAPNKDSLLAYAMINLGYAKNELGKLEESESLYVHAIAAARRVYGDEHPELAAMLSPYATVLERAGKSDQADSVYRQVLAMRLKLLGPEHPEYAWTMFNYADFLLTKERYAEAVEWSKKVLALRGNSLPETHMAVSTAMRVLGLAMDELDSLPQGEYYLRESLRLRQAALPEGHWLLASSQSMIGAHLALVGQYDEAERLLLDSEAKLVEARGESGPEVRDVRGRLVKLYELWGRADQAEQWRAKQGS